MKNAYEKVVIACSFTAVAVLITAIEWQTNRRAFDTVMGELHGIFLQAWVGILILFFTGLTLGVTWCILRMARERNVIRPGKHGPAQVLIHRGEVVLLNQPVEQLDPAKQMAMVKQVMQLSATLARSAKQLELPSAEHEALPEPQESIPEVVRYAEIANQVPGELSLLGIHPDSGQLEIGSPEQLKTAWFVGGSNSGKTNTVYGKVADAVRWGERAGTRTRIIIADNHAHKPDSLANKLKDFHGNLLIPIAQDRDEIKRAMLLFLKEFQARKQGKRPTEKWLFVADEVNATCNITVQLTEAEIAWLYKEYGVKIKGNTIKLQVLFKIMAETCGYESRGFDMFGFFISQKAAGLAWLRNAMMTVFVHALLMYSEALLAANDNRQLAEQVMQFKKGRTLVYGYEVDRMILQQPKYDLDERAVESTVSYSSNASSNDTTEPLPEGDFFGQEDAPEAPGRTEGEIDAFTLRKILNDVGKMKAQGASNDAILEHLGLNKGGRHNQNLKVLIELAEKQAEEA